MENVLKEELKYLLEEERRKLIGELSSFGTEKKGLKEHWNVSYPKFEDGKSSSSSSMEEQADEVEEYEERLAAEESLESRLLEVTRALERMSKGTYGTCGKCGKEISIERLRANPAAEFDIEHA